MSIDKSELQITSADISAGQWCTPEFNKDIVTAAILIPKDCNSLDINFKVTNGATVYKDSKSDANLLNAEEDGNYKLTIDTSKITSSLTQRIVLYKVLEDGSEMLTTYTFTIYKRGKLVGMPDKVVDYFCPGSQYSNMTLEGIIPIYLSGIPFNIVHAIATVFFLAVISKPMIEKLDRIKEKYGLIEP